MILCIAGYASLELPWLCSSRDGSRQEDEQICYTQPVYHWLM